VLLDPRVLEGLEPGRPEHLPANGVLKPSLSAARQPQIWLLSSAPHPDSDVLRRYCLRGRAGEDKDLAYFEWSAPLDAAPDSFEAWAQSNPALGRRIAVETVASELKALEPGGVRP
jgi:hypothetical protein